LRPSWPLEATKTEGRIPTAAETLWRIGIVFTGPIHQQAHGAGKSLNPQTPLVRLLARVIWLSIRKCRMGTKLNTKQAAKYCTDHDKETEKSTLDTLRSIGGGPVFEKQDGRKPIWYDTDDLDEWIKSSSAPMKKYRSTSEYSTRKNPKPNGAPPEDKSSSDPSPDDGEGE
jgi:hypothetical protein